MNEPLFWLGLSLTLVAVSLTSVLVTIIPLVQQLNNTARSAEKLFDILNQEFPHTLEAIRQTNLELTELSEEMKEGVKSASSTVKQIDVGLISAKEKVNQAQNKGKSFWIGLKTGIKTWQNYNN